MPERWKGPPLTQEYLVWYLDEYVPPPSTMRASCSPCTSLCSPAGAPAGGGACVAVLPVLSEGPRTEEGLLPPGSRGFLGILGFSSGSGSTASPTTLDGRGSPVRPVLAGPPPLGDPWVSARRRGGPCLRADLKFSHRQFPPQAKTPPLPTAQVPLPDGKGVCLMGLGGLGGRCPPPRRKGRQKGVPHLAVSLHRDGDPGAVHHLHLIGPDADQVGAVDRIGAVDPVKAGPTRCKNSENPTLVRTVRPSRQWMTRCAPPPSPRQFPQAAGSRCSPLPPPRGCGPGAPSPGAGPGCTSGWFVPRR